MPGFPDLKAEEVQALAHFIVSSLGKEGAPAAVGPSLPPGDPGRGRAYFTGRLRFAGGGAPCLACHVAGSHGAASGGTLGTDLTGAARRYGGAAGLAAALKSAPFPVMRASYAGKPLTEQERADLASFFGTLGDPGPTRSGLNDGFWAAGLLGTLILFAVVAVIGSRRGLSPARRLRELGKRGRKS
jgi:hypothetical protein